MNSRSQQPFNRTGTKSRFYKKSRLFRGKKVYQAFLDKNPEVTESVEELRQMFFDIMDTASTMLIEQKDGVLLEGIGYFAGTVYDRKRLAVPVRDKSVTNFATGGMVYKFDIFGSVYRNRRYRYWSFALDRDKARAVPTMIDRGIRYKNHFHFLRSLKNYGQKYFLRKPNG